VNQECDSGVKNQLLERGCTINDKIAECSTEYYYTATDEWHACIDRFVTDWEVNGLITSQEAEAIMACP